MENLYWITRLDSIRTVIIVIFCCAIVLFIFGTIFHLAFNDSSEDDKNGIKMMKIAILCGILPLFGIIFIPSTKDAYIIYGVGGTIDYLKNDSTARQLPDKAVKALNAFMDNEIKNKTKQDQNE